MKPVLWSIAIVFLGSCAGVFATNESGIVLDQPIDIGFQLNDEVHRLAGLRGRPVVLVLMRTSEVSSMAHIREVKTAYEHIAGRIQFLVLTAEPTEAPFVGPYVESEKLPFPIGIAEPSVALGLSPLGRVPIIPSTYFIDSSGVIVDAAPGLTSSDVIIETASRYAER
jgi:hypothetical protein